MNKILPLAKRSRSSFIEADGAELFFDDQGILQAVNISYPNEVNVLPPGWDMDIPVSNIWQTNNITHMIRSFQMLACFISVVAEVQS